MSWTSPASPRKLSSLARTTDEGHQGPSVVQRSVADIERRRAWADAKFGVFVHWGVFASLGGIWKGKKVEGLAEWIQLRARIPHSDYADLAKSFNPVGFNARDWVKMASDAGAKYFVYTAKHHDGFAMYHSEASAYNIVDATMFDRDPLMEIAEACAEFNIMLGIYYSQTIDWEDPDAVGPSFNDWDFEPADADFDRYWRRKALPQIRELLSNYGDIGLLWFDMPSGIPADCAAEAFDTVRELQPGAVINSRLGGGVEADYMSMDDNYFNNSLPLRDWETAATTNDSWGFSELASGWKPVAGLCETLAYTVSRGGNLLLNIGPDADGEVPEKTLSQFAGIGAWMQRATPAIHKAGPSPFPGGFSWGYVTTHGSSIYLHVADPNKNELSVYAGTATPANVLDLGTGEPLAFEVNDPSGPTPLLSLELAPPTDELPRTIEMAFTDVPEVPQEIVQVADSALQLDIWGAQNNVKDPAANQSLHWTFTMTSPGDYHVVLLSKETFSNFDPQWWAAGMTGTLLNGAVGESFTLHRDGEEPYPILHYWKVIRSEISQIHVSSIGKMNITIEGLSVVDSKWDKDGVNMIGIRLEPIESPVPAADSAV